MHSPQSVQTFLDIYGRTRDTTIKGFRKKINDYARLNVFRARGMNNFLNRGVSYVSLLVIKKVWRNKNTCIYAL